MLGIHLHMQPKHPRQLLHGLGIVPRRSLSQCFLTSSDWAQRLVHALLNEKRVDEIWEIGPGLGALTRPLVSATQSSIKIFELDRKIAPYLRTEFPTVNVIEGDFLRTQLREISPNIHRIGIVANLPYHISSPVFFKILNEPRIETAVLTFQKEFAERLIARPRTKAYGALSVMAQSFFEIHSLGLLPPSIFYPKPEVSSEALILKSKKPASKLLDSLSPLVKRAFQHRRKKLWNNLKLHYPCADLNGLFAKFMLKPTARAEELSVPIYIQMTEELSNHAAEPGA